MKYAYKNYKKQIKISNHLLKNGFFGFKVNHFFQISDNQQIRLLTYLIQKIKLTTKRKIKIWNGIYLNQNLTKLNSESRMGKGKGVFLKKACFLTPGNILFEIDKLSKSEVIDIYNNLNKKIPKKLILIKKFGY